MIRTDRIVDYCIFLGNYVLLVQQRLHFLRMEEDLFFGFYLLNVVLVVKNEVQVRVDW